MQVLRCHQNSSPPFNDLRLSFLCLLLSFFFQFTLAQSSLFEDISTLAGIANGGDNSGIAFADYDNDGDADVFISRRQNDNILYQNQEDGTFKDVSIPAGLGFAAVTKTSVWGDLDNDGWLDLYLGNFDEADALYLNNRNGTFTDITQEAGISNIGKPLSVLMSDMDNDGNLDIYIANFASENVLYHNNGDGTFTDVTQESGALDASLSMGAIFFDYDNDGDSDLYLVHDGNIANILYRNNGDGTFTDVSELAEIGYQGLGMGVDAGDMNRDGFLDLYITNLGPNVLFLNNGNGTFSNGTIVAEVNDGGMGWSTMAFDFDNDGWEDIYAINDSHFSPAPNVLYHNLGMAVGGNPVFEIVEQNAPISSMQGGYGGAFADIENDGQLDLLVGNTGSNETNQLFKNLGNENHWIAFRLEGTQSNRSAIGAKVEIQFPGGRQVEEVTAGSGFVSQNSMIIHFGLGVFENVESVQVFWPSGLEDSYNDLSADLFYKIKEDASLEVLTATQESQPSFRFRNFPNPFSSFTTFSFELTKKTSIHLTIFDRLGRVVMRRVSSFSNLENPEIKWNGTDASGQQLPAGIYFYSISSGDSQIAGKVILQK